LWLIAATFYGRSKRSECHKKIGIINSLVIGVAQGIAVIPGISRSGATIGAGILSGIDKEAVFKFSFLLAIPAILGASLLKCGKISAGLTSGDYLHFLSGAFAAMITGLISVSVLLKIVKANKLYIFGIYCILAAVLIISVL
jgi:undecaprenyl-diphosphatase